VTVRYVREKRGMSGITAAIVCQCITAAIVCQWLSHWLAKIIAEYTSVHLERNLWAHMVSAYGEKLLLSSDWMMQFYAIYGTAVINIYANYHNVLTSLTLIDYITTYVRITCM
jgi:hypothetical protein